jgi:hypothetical protein
MSVLALEAATGLHALAALSVAPMTAAPTQLALPGARYGRVQPLLWSLSRFQTCPIRTRIIQGTTRALSSARIHATARFKSVSLATRFRAFNPCGRGV